VVFVGACFAVFWGTVFPVISEAVRGVKITVGPPFFNSVNVPIFLFLLFLTGVGPLVAWRKSSPQHLRKIFLKPTIVMVVTFVALYLFGIHHFYALLSFSLGAFVVATIVSEFHRGALARRKTHQESYFLALYRLIERNKRRYGGYIVHFAIVVIFFGVTGAAFDKEVELNLKEGESQQVGAYQVVYKGHSTGQDAHKQWLRTTLQLKKHGQIIKNIHPQRNLYLAQQQPTTEVAVYSTPVEDFYVVLVGVDDKTNAASFKVYLKPLVSLVWFGGMILTIGTLICLLPGVQDRKKFTPAQRKTARAAKTVHS
ncbi:MAG: heme lyase CcmF/NrfE family subunit, partial [Calditrichaeota bacterium]